MSKFVGIKTYERFRSLWENNDIDEFSLNFILDTGQLYTHGVFINSAVFGTAANGAVLLSIAGTTNTLALSSHIHSNYYDKSENLDITNHKIISGDNDLLFCSGGALYIGNINNPTYISGSTIQSIKGLNTYTILDTENFSISNTLPTGYTHNNTAYIEYGGNSFLIDYVKRVNTSLSFDYLNSYTLAGTNLLNGDYYGYINFTVDNVYNNPAWAQLRINITGRSIQYRTSADVNNWINLGIPSIPLNALNVAGIVSAPNANTQNKVWKTDENGNPGWRDERIYSFASLVFQQIAGTELESYNTLTLKTILAGSNISFSCEDNVITINALDTTYSAFTGASANNDGSSGLVTAPNAGLHDKFLRGDGTWNTPLNTWRPIYLLGTAALSNSSTYLNIAPGNNISLAYTAPGTETGLSGNVNYATLTISATNTWIAWEGATETNNGTAGYMPAPTSALRNLFLRGDGTWISLNDYTLPTATNLVLGGIKVGTTLEDVSGYTAIHIKDGVAYYKDTTYSFSNLLFLQTSGTNLMTYNSQAARTILAGSNITFTHSNNILTIAAKDTTYSTVSKTAAGLCPILPDETTTTKYLRLDGTWVTPPNDNTWTDFTGATASAAGTKGVILAPAGAQNKFFRGDNTWLTISQNVTSALYVGASNGTGNSAQSTNGNVYLIFAEGSSYSRYKISGSDRASVTSDANGNITINSSGYSNFGAATASAAGSAGLVPAPGANVLGSSGYYLRADGTWLKPPNDNTWNANAVGVAGYVAAPTKAANANMTWLTDADGNPAWRASNNHSHNYLPLSGANYNTSTDTNPFIISRTGGTTEAMLIMVNDSRTLFKYTNDETASSIVFQLVNTDTESGSGAAASDRNVTILSNNTGIFLSVGGTLVSLSGHKHAYTDLTGSSTTANQAIVSTGTANGWTLKTLGSRAFDSTSYLPLSGGTLTSSRNNVLTLNSTNASETGIQIQRNGTIKAWFGYYDGFAYMYNATRGAYLRYNDDGTLTFEGKLVYHSGNLTNLNQLTNGPGYLTETTLPYRLQASANNSGHPTTPNDFMVSGFAWCSSGSPGGGGDCNLITVAHNESGWCHQLAFKFNSAGTTGTTYDSKDLWTRMYNNSNKAWTDWFTIVTSGNWSKVIPYPAGFTSRGTSDWSGVAGTLATDWSVNGADIMFKYDGSKLNVITDGRFYQGIDIYGASKRVLDEYDITHTKWGDADTVDGYHFSDLESRYVNTTGDTMSAALVFSGVTGGNYNEGIRIQDASNKWAGITFGATGSSGCTPLSGEVAWFVAKNPGGKFGITPNTSTITTGLELIKDGDIKWRNLTIIHSGNISSQSVNYATSAGNADTVDSQHFKWSNDSNSPTYLWAANSSGTAFLCARGSMSVNYATSAGNADTVGSYGLSKLKTRLSNHKLISGGTSAAGWYRILDCTTYSMTFLITFYGGYNYCPPTPVTFLVSHSYSVTTISQIGKCAYTGWITSLRAVHHDTYKFYIDVYFAISGNTNAGNPVAFEVTPLDPNYTSYTLIDYTKQSNGNGDAKCDTSTSFNVDYASSAGSVAWSNISSKPETATRWPSWSEVTSKPSTFTPSSHTHAFSLVTDGTSSSTNSGWSHILSNTYGGSQKSILYMCHGGGYGMHLRGYSTSSSVYMLLIYNSSKEVFGVYGDGHSNFGGNVNAPNYYTTSDRAKKQNISEFSEHIRKFQLKDTEKWHYGVIALEVPEMFRLGEEGNMTVNYNSVLSYYVGCLENSVAGLEAAKRLLENRVKELELEVLKLKTNNYDNTK